MAEQVPQAVAGGAIAQVVQNPQPAQGEPAGAQQAQDQPLAQQAQNQEVCIFFCFRYHVVDYISVANFLSVEFRFGLLSVDVKLCQACGAVKVFSLPAGPLKLLACEAVKVFFACGAVKVFSLPARP